MLTLLAVSPFLALILAAASILGLRLLRPGFAHRWLIAAGGGLLAWGLLLASGTQLPLNLPLANWQPRILLPLSPVLLLDRISWTFGLAVVSLNLAFILTNVVARASTSGQPIPSGQPSTSGQPIPSGSAGESTRALVPTSEDRSPAERSTQGTQPSQITQPIQSRATPYSEPASGTSPLPVSTGSYEAAPPAPTGGEPGGHGLAPIPGQPAIRISGPEKPGRPGGSWGDLTSALVLSAVALVGGMAGNLLTLLLGWTLLDLVEAVVWLGKARTRRESESVVIGLATRLLGVGVAIWTGASAYAKGQSMVFSLLSPQLSPYLLIAAALRLGVLPLRPPLPRSQAVPAGLRTLLRLAPAAASLTILARAASAPWTALQINLLLALAGLAALLGGLIWLGAASVREGLPYWMAGGFGLALAAAVRGQPLACLSWGLATLLVGGMIGLAVVRPRAVGSLLLLGLLGFTGLPFTPAWQGVKLYSQPFFPLLPVFLAGQGLLLAGLARHAMRRIPAPPQAERWIWIIYPLGLVMLPAMHFLTAWWPAPGLMGGASERPSWLASGMVAIPLGLGLAIFLLQHSRRARKRRAARRQALPAWLQRVRSGLELSWLYRLAWQIYRLSGQFGAFLSSALEGQAGLLWALLVLTLLLSLLAGPGLGGG